MSNRVPKPKAPGRRCWRLIRAINSTPQYTVDASGILERLGAAGPADESGAGSAEGRRRRHCRSEGTDRRGDAHVVGIQRADAPFFCWQLRTTRRRV